MLIFALIYSMKFRDKTLLSYAKQLSGIEWFQSDELEDREEKREDNKIKLMESNQLFRPC